MSTRASGIVTAIAALVFALGLPVTAAAQQQPQAPADITDSDLQSFAEAAAEVQALRQEWRPRLEAAEDEAEAAELQQQANMQMIAAVENSGITVDAYNQIAMAIQQNPELGEQVEEYMSELQ